MRATKRKETNNRAGTATQSRILAGTNTQQKPRGPETSGPATRSASSPARDVSTGNSHIQTIAAQQQQMQQMQQMMFAMQQQMTTLQQTIATMATQPTTEPLITGPTGTNVGADGRTDAPSGANIAQQDATSSSRTAGTAASGSPPPQLEKESTATQPPPKPTESVVRNPAPQPDGKTGIDSTSRDSNIPHKSKRGGRTGLQRERGSKRRPASGPPLIRSMTGVILYTS